MLQKGTLERKTRANEITYTLSETNYGEDEGINILLCGTTKSGRTQLASTFPDVLFLNADHGLNTPAVRKSTAKQIPLQRGEETSRKIMDILFKIEEKQPPFDKWQPKTIVFDSITAISEHLEEECRIYDPESEKNGRGDGLYLADYNSIFTRAIRAIDSAKGLVPYFICIANVEMNLDPILQANVESPSASGKKLPIHIPHAFDEVYYCGFDTTVKQFFIATEKTARFKYSGTKNNVPAKVLDPTFDKLVKYYKS